MTVSGIVKRHDKKWLLWTALVFAAITFFGSRALAYDYYLLDFEGTYPNAQYTNLDSCTLCHPGSPFDYVTLNSYASDYALSTIGNHTFNQALSDADSDGDGFINGTEINALTFPGDYNDHPAAAPTVNQIVINGPSSVTEGTTASYEATAVYSDGSSATVSPAWGVSPGTAATINSSGLLTALQVASDQAVTVSAVFSGVTANQSVTIVDIPPLPADTISLYPQDGATDVPITTVVVVTLNGSGDIADIVNDTTFSLTAAGSGSVAGAIDYNDSHTEATFTPLNSLANGTAYTATVVPATGTQPALGSPVSTTFTTVAAAPDTDGDGVGDGEDDLPNDSGRATPPCVRRSGKFLVDTYGNAGVALRNVEGISDMYPQFNRHGRPFGYHFPDGMVRYKLSGVHQGGTVTVTISFPSGVPHGSRIFKVDSNGFHEHAGAIVSGHKVTLTLTDGGVGDADGTANGEIDDPVGVAVPDAVSGSGASSASGSCSVAGSGGGWSDAVGSFGFIALAVLWLALRRRKPVIGA